MSGMVKEAVRDASKGRRANRMRAFLVAVVAGYGAAVITYRVLRSAGS